MAEKTKRSWLDIIRGKKAPRTKDIQKGAGDTDISHMVTPGVEKKKPAKTTPKPPKRKVPPSTKENIDRAHKLSMMLKRKSEENEKKREKTKMTGKK